MRDTRNEEVASSLRVSLLCLVFLGVLGTAIALAYHRHWDSIWQLAPWAALGAIFLALLLLIIRPTPFPAKLARGIAVVTILVAGVGMWLHFERNYEAAPLDALYSDRWETMSLADRLLEVGKGSVGHVPIYAAGLLIPIALALIMATIGMERPSNPGEYIDPRRR